MSSYQRPGKTYDKAVADGWVPGETLFGIEEACERATIIAVLLSDAAQIACCTDYRETSYGW